MSSSATPFEVKESMSAWAFSAAVVAASSTVSPSTETPRPTSTVSGVPVTSPMPETEMPEAASSDVFTVISCGVDPAAVPQAARRTARPPISAMLRRCVLDVMSLGRADSLNGS